MPAARLAPYEAACSGTRTDPIELYRWAALLGLAAFDDIATVEVALRSAMASALTATYGPTWSTRTDLLDDQALALIADATRAGRLTTASSSDQVVQDRLVSGLMLGFWVKLLGKGTWQGRAPRRERRVYDTTLWKPALRHAFPGAGDLDRARVASAARRSLVLRNRIAHHEQILWGIPLPGERTADGAMRRVPLGLAHSTVVELADFLDAGLASWLRERSQVPVLLGRCPVDRSRFRL